MKISFVTTCKGRTFHLKETYIKNIKNAISEYKYIEFILVNYDSPDDMDGWVTRELGNFIRNGILKYIYVKNKKYYSHPHATNIAIRESVGDIVVVLEADNFLLNGFVSSIIRGFCIEKYDYMKFKYKKGGANSRMAIKRNWFDLLNGFNESLSGWGYDDEDFFYRLKLLKFLKVGFFDDFFASVIEHSSVFRKRYSPYGLLPIPVSRNINVLRSKISIFLYGFKARNNGQKYGYIN